MARNKRSASPERAKKKRKVVLVKAQAAAEQRGRAESAAKATAKAPRPKPQAIPGGPAGRLLQFLGQRAEHPRSGSNTERAAEAQVEKEKPQPAQKASVRAKHSSPNKTTKKGGKCIPESDSDSSSDSRSSSPSPSPSPIMAPAVVPAKVAKRPKAASPKKEPAQKVGKVKKRAAPPAALAPPAKAKKINDGSSVATAPAKPKKTSEVPAAQVKAKKTKPPEVVKPPKPAAPAPAPTAQPELSELDQMGLQDAVLERLRTLCDKDVDPKVLAEYIVVLAQMNKGPDHLSGELEAFFSDKALLQSFVRWVEDSKWSFVPGGQPLKPVRSAQAGKGAQIDLRGLTPDTNGTARQKNEAVSAGPKTVRQGPHVAVTSRVVLQPNPNFDISPPVVKAPIPIINSPIKSPVAKVTAKTPPRVAPYMLPPSHSAEAKQVQLLGEFTKTLQTILTKLQNPELDDSQRERYQAMADKIHSKIKTIKLAGSAPVRRR